MKKYLLILCALLLTAVGASAQVDYTSYLEDGTWSSASTCPSLSSAHESYNGSGSNSAGKILYCTVNDLPAGTYSLSFYVAANAANVSGVVSGDNIAQAYVSAGGTVAGTKDITVGTVTNMNNSWSNGTLCELTVTLASAGSIEFGIQNVATGGNWYVCEGKSLVCTSATLTEGDVAHYCVAWDDEWEISEHSTGTFQRNVWSTEADASGMVTPWVEYWVYNDDGANTLSPATISHETITGLTAGYYEVSIDIRIFSEAGNEITLGGTLSANGASEDLLSGSEIHSGTYNGETEVYGTCHLLTEVTTDGTLAISIVIPENVPYNWISFKNLKVVYDGASAPTLDYVTGDMNAAVEEAMKAAVDKYNKSLDADDYTAALAAIEEAEASVAYYAPIVAAVAALDEAGAAVWAESDYAEMLTNRTLTDEDVSADLTAAQKAQTTANTDWSYVLKNTGTWVNAISATNFQACPSLPTAHEIWSSAAWTLPSGATSAEAIYKRIEDLPAGEYTISFYAYGSEGANASRPLAFANDAETTVAYAAALAWNESSLYTLQCTVDVDGILDFGMKTQGDGNWYVMEEYSLTLDALTVLEDVDSDYHTGDVVTVDGTNYDVLGDNEIENHSFELGFEGWTDASNDHNTITSDNFELRTDDPKTGDHYLVGTSWSGSFSSGSLCTAWEIEPATTYYFSYWVKNLSGDEETDYLVTSLTNTIGEEDYSLGYPASVSSDWQLVEYVFTNGEEGAEDYYQYVQVKFRWLATQQGVDNWGFDDFSLHKVQQADESILWEMTSAGWGTMIIPFDAEIPTGLTLYAGDALTLDDTTITVGDAATSIVANTPYLVSGSAAKYEFTGVATNTQDSYQVGMLVGTLVDLSQDAGTLTSDGTEYVLQNHDDEGLAFYPINSSSSGVTLDAYHCYLTTTSGISALNLPGMSTAIEAVESDVIASDAIYDLSGRRVAKAVKGVYIMNGKKVLVK